MRVTSFRPGVPNFSGGDPAVYFDKTGAALFTSIVSPPDSHSQVWRSSDGGVHWDSVTKVPGGVYDREYLAVDTTSGPYSGRVYFAGTIVGKQVQADGNSRSFPAMGIAYSSNNGLSFHPSTVVDASFSDGPSGGFGGVGDLLISSKGTLLIPFQATLDMKPTPPRAFWMFVSEDGGRTFSSRQGPAFDRGPMSIRRRVTAGSVHAAIDATRGVFANRVYFAWVDYNNGRYDVKVAHSDDLGLTWSAAVKVNDNVGPNDPSNIALAVNRNGVLALIWNDRRDDPSNLCFRVYASASLDGGDTFLPNISFSPRPVCFNTPGNWSGSINTFPTDNGIQLTSVSDRFSNGGETQGLAAGHDGRFHAIWDNDVAGVMQLWYTSFEVPGRVVGGGKAAESTALGSDAGLPSDLTKLVSFEVSRPSIDFQSKTITVAVAIRNKSPRTLPAAVTLTIDKIETDFKGLAVQNADNGLFGPGASWRLVGQRTSLDPGESSETREIKWRFDGTVPEPKNLLSQFIVSFKVLGR